jgi:hypothetical protein
LRYNTSPFNPISDPRTFNIQEQRSEIDELFVAASADKNAVLVIESEMGGVSFWVDNLVLQEVQAKITDPEDVFLFAYNDSNGTKSLPLSGEYVDLEGKVYAGNISLPPFSSVPLIRTSSKSTSAPPPIAEVRVVAPATGKQVTEGDEVFIQLDVAASHQQNIDRVNYYHNDKLISTEKEDPLTCKWENVPYGKHYVYARVVDKQGRQTASDSVIVEARRISEIPGGSGGGFSMFVNTGSGNVARWNSQEFEGEQHILGSISGTTYTFSNPNASGEPLFQTERNSENMLISVPVPNGKYTVRTFHNELWFGHGGPAAQARRRVFDISIGNKRVKENFDIFKENNNRPTVLSFENIDVTNGVLELRLKAVSNRATISGLAIIREDGQSSMKPAPGLKALHLKTGDRNNTDYQGITYVSDFDFPDYVSASHSFSNGGASQEALFQSERNAEILKYSIPVPNGTYIVKTYHNELWFGHAGPSARSGRRVFDIIIENKTVKSRFDIFLENNNRPTILTFEEINVNDGILNIDMMARSNRASVSAISITQVSALGDKKTEEYSFYLNSGGLAAETFGTYQFTGENGSTQFYSTGSSRYENTGASPEKIFQTERNADRLIYSIPVPNGVYTVYTLHNELWFGHAGPEARAGRRVFDILIENKMVKPNFDFFIENGNRPVTLVFEHIEVKDGRLDIDMRASANRASVSGIAVVGQGSKLALEGANLRSFPEMERPDTAMGGKQENQKQPMNNGSIKIYPNPARDRVTIQLPRDIEKGSVLIYSMEGKLVSHVDLDKGQTEGNSYILSLENIPKGIFLLSITDQMQVLDRQRLIVAP